MTTCPRIYETCVVGDCPQVQENGDSYIIVGKRVEPSEVGLEGGVAEGEALIEVPKKLIDERER